MSDGILSGIEFDSQRENDKQSPPNNSQETQNRRVKGKRHLGLWAHLLSDPPHVWLLMGQL